MKPRTKLQFAVEESAKALLPVSDKEKAETFSKCSPHIFLRTAKGVHYCLDCGHVWNGEKKSDKKHVVCPHCGRKLTFANTHKRKIADSFYVANLTTCNGFQVLRMFYYSLVMRRGQKPKTWLKEVYQKWYTAEGKLTVRSITMSSFSYIIDAWCWTSDLEVRAGEGRAHNIVPFAYFGKTRVLPELKKRGFKTSTHGIEPSIVIQCLLTNAKFESLWKMGCFSILSHFCRKSEVSYSINEYWKQLVIANRHKYQIKDASLWIDMINAIRYLRLDDRNPKFICPADLKATHDEFVAKRRRKQERERAEAMRELRRQRAIEAKKEAKKYIKTHGCYFGLEFKDNEISVTPLKSVEEFYAEGEAQHHCVFTNRYYAKKDTLILHATIGDEIIATIELNLASMQILQCRGKHNSVPEHKERIEKLITNNLGKIAKCKKQKAA